MTDKRTMFNIQKQGLYKSRAITGKTASGERLSGQVDKILKSVLLLATLLVQFNLHAQKTAYYGSTADKTMLIRELFLQKKYVSAYHECEKLQATTDEHSALFAEAEFYKAAATLRSGNRTGAKLLTAFIENYPTSPFVNRARLELANDHYSRKAYKAAIRIYEQIDRDRLSGEELDEFRYKYGFSLMEENRLAEALREFDALYAGNSIFQKPATYYRAHILYEQGDYNQALEAFKSLNGDPAYSQVIPIYVSHIYYKQENYGEVINYSTSIIDDVQEEHRAELSKIIGDSYFHLKEYKKAIPYLETFFESKGPRTREENYILGFCYYQNGDYQKAVDLLKKASAGEDQLAQNAYYHLAACFIKLNQKELAQTAYEAASKFDFDAVIKEDALFNFAKLSYELSYSPFNETIKAFDRYISEYPNSPRNAEAYKILVDVYMVTRNYKDAISSIEKIQNKTPDILKAYQRVTFYRGLELFENQEFEQAIELFNRSLDFGQYNRQLKARALFWKAEAFYRLGDYTNALIAANMFEKTPGSQEVKESAWADYTLAYTYWKLNEANKAATYFKRYLKKEKGQQSPRVADAFNRLGDYYFSIGKYADANLFYREAYNLHQYEADYALLQIALCSGLQHQQAQKISSLEALLTEFPTSDYADNALFELGRAYERNENNAMAITKYQTLVEQYPGSELKPKALLQLGLANFNQGNFEQALKQYKAVAENYRGTEEAQSALSGIKNCYVEMNDVNAYFRYVKKMGGEASITPSEQDRLTYLAAERVYMDNKPEAKEQLETYLQQFPNGAFQTNAHFYLAELLMKEGNTQEALRHYLFVTQQPRNIFSEQALAQASELLYKEERFEEALNLFQQLEELSTNKWNSLKASVGQMRIFLQNKNYEAAIAAAEKVKQSEVADKNLLYEADYTIGKSNYELGHLNNAIDPLRDVAKNPQTEAGAEAQYLLAEIYFQNKQLVKAEQEIIHFADTGTPHTYWLGKSFLLLASIYEAKGDDFQAKHTLKSLADNYNIPDDGIIDEAQKRLARFMEQESREQQNALDSSFQMQIKQN